jgi:membrane-bound ClpP family serine protease
LLLVAGLALAVLEVFIPSGGILGFLAICAILASIVVAFMEGSGPGLIFLATAIFGLPLVIVFALKYWPRTAIGQKVLLVAPGSDEVLPEDDQRRELRKLIGQEGRAKSPMLPSGVISIDGRSLDAVSEGVPIEPGQAVRVIDVQATTLVVRPVEEGGPVRVAPGSDPLSRPIDAVGPDPFEDSGA